MAIDYYLRNTNNDSTCDAGATVADYDLDKSQGSGPNTVDSGPLTNTSYAEIFTWDIDVSGDSPATGSHTVKVNLSTVSKGNVRWRIQEISSGCSVLNNSSYSTVYTSTGAKSDSLSLTWSTGNRLRLSLEFQFTGKGSGSVSVSTEDSSSVINTPWTVGVDYVEVVDETEQISEGVLTVADFVRLINETEQISETTPTAADYVRMIGTALSKKFVDISETVVTLRSIVKVIGFPLALKKVEVSENIVTVADYVRLANDVEQLTETLVKAAVYVRVTDEDEEISENVLTVADFVRLINETEQISETVVTKLSVGGLSLVEVIDETEQISELVVTLKSMVELINETEQISEGVITAMDLVRVQDATVQISESIIRVLDMTRPVNETVQISETLVTARDLVRILSSTIEISESVITPRDMVRGESPETVSIQEQVIASLQVPIWSEIQQPTMLPQTEVDPVYTPKSIPSVTYNAGATPVVPTYSKLTGGDIGEAWSRVYPRTLGRSNFDTPGEVVSDTFDYELYANLEAPSGIYYYSEPKVLRLRGWSSLAGPGTPAEYYTAKAGIDFTVVSPIRVHYRFKWAAKGHFTTGRVELICPDPSQGYYDPVHVEHVAWIDQEDEDSWKYMKSVEGSFVLPDAWQDLEGTYRFQFVNRPPQAAGQASFLYLDDVDIFITAAVEYSGHPVT